MKIKRISKRTAKIVMGVGIAVLLAGQWALVSGPVSRLGQSGLDAAAHSDGLGVAMYGGLHLLLLAGLPLISGFVGLCVLAVYSAYSQTIGADDDVIDMEPVALPRNRQGEGKA